MNKVIFYSFKIENINFHSAGDLSTSTPFVKNDAVANLKQQLQDLGYKMAADNSHKIIKIGAKLYIEGMAYQGEDPDHRMIAGYFNPTR